jgi:HEAT repeat protein
MPPLSPAALQKARRSFFFFNALNSVSFLLVSGSLITLYALSLGASNAVIGVLNAFASATFFLLPLGKRLVRDRPIIEVFGRAWLWRYVSMVPALLAPLLSRAGAQGAAIATILVGVALFNALRGVGMIGNNPVLAHLADGGSGGKRSDRGAFLVNAQIAASIAGMITNLIVALSLGRSAPSWAFALAVGVGIAFGLCGTFILMRSVPEPEAYRSERSEGLWKNAREAMKEKPFRVFIEVFFFLAFAAGMARSFLPVYAKDVFGQGDGAVMAYSLVGSVGSLAMGLLTRLLVDRLGAKPLYVIFTAVAALSLLPIPAAPGPVGVFAGPFAAALMFIFINFFSSFGFSGEENAAQTYFFSLVRPERTLDLGVVYYLVYGLGGTLGSALGGLALDALYDAGLSDALSFRIFYGFLFIILVAILFRMSHLVRLGSVSVRESLGVLLSIRDLRTFNLLSRLEKSGDPEEEIGLIHEIGEDARGSASDAAQDSLLEYLSSPRFDVRTEALIAIENMGHLSPEAVEALVLEVERQPYTTAYLAARILGKSLSSQTRDAEPDQRRERVLPVLRKAARAEDYMLQASAVVALARLGDRDSIPLVEDCLVSSRIPRVRISAAFALELLSSRASIPALVSCLRIERDPAFVSDELVLSTASILGLMPAFYRLYVTFLDDEATGLVALGDSAAEAFGGSKAQDRAVFDEALGRLMSQNPDGAPMSRFLLDLAKKRRDRSNKSAVYDDAGVCLVLSEALLDPGLGYRGLRFMIAAYAIKLHKTSSRRR